jgi:hypothetical protein
MLSQFTVEKPSARRNAHELDGEAASHDPKLTSVRSSHARPMFDPANPMPTRRLAQFRAASQTRATPASALGSTISAPIVQVILQVIGHRGLGFLTNRRRAASGDSPC